MSNLGKINNWPIFLGRNHYKKIDFNFLYECPELLQFIFEGPYSDQRFQRIFFYEFFHVRIVQKISFPLGGHVFPQIKISQTIFEMVHPRNNPAKLFQNLTNGFRGEDFFKEFL